MSVKQQIKLWENFEFKTKSVMYYKYHYRYYYYTYHYYYSYWISYNYSRKLKSVFKLASKKYSSTLP